MNAKIREFYVEVMNCGNTNKDCKQAWKDVSTGIVPRAFMPCTSSKALILVIAKNPGHPIDGENMYFQGKTGMELFEAKEAFDLEKHIRIETTNDISLRFHRNLRRYLRYFLGITRQLETYEQYRLNYSTKHEKDIFRYVALTNLYKCSTNNEREKIGTQSFQTCYDKYLCREIELWRPRVILALGQEVFRFLNKQDPKVPIVPIRHPSYCYRKADEKRILSTIRGKLTRILSHQEESRKPKSS